MANYIEKNDDKLAVSSLTDEDTRTIVALSKDERITERVRDNKHFERQVRGIKDFFLIYRLFKVSLRLYMGMNTSNTPLH